MVTSKRTQQRKIGIFLVVVFVLFVSPVFASEVCGTATTEALLKGKNALMWIGEIASRIWILLANFAGKLMTNTMVYGEFMNLDTFLWKIRQISRNFANYAIGLFFLYSILKYILIPSAKASPPMSTIKELLIASILVQSSWFLVMATVDISTIGLATVSSFPSQVIANSSKYQNTFQANIQKSEVLGSLFQTPPKVVRINAFADHFTQNTKEYGFTRVVVDEASPSFSKEQIFDDLMPKADNLAGPFVYLGFSVMQTHQFLKEYEVNDSNCVEIFTKITTSLVLDAGMIILYTFALAILVIVLIIRLAYLWIFISASPIIFLLYGTKKILNLGNLSSFLDLKNIVSLIFKPVLFGLWIGLMTLFIITMQGFFNTNSSKAVVDGGSLTIKESSSPRQKGGKDVQEYNSELLIGEGMKMTISQGTKSFKDILLSLLSLAMMRYFVKLALTSKTGIQTIDSLTSNVVQTTEKIIGNIPVIPTSTGGLGFSQIWDGNTSPLLKAATRGVEDKRDKFNTEGTKQIGDFFGIERPIDSLSSTQKDDLDDAAKVGAVDDFPKLIKTIKSKNGGIRFSEIKPYLPDWINKNEINKGKLQEYLGTSYQWKKIDTKDAESTENGIKALFTSQQVLKSFYKNILGGNENSISGYDQLDTSLHGEVKAER